MYNKYKKKIRKPTKTNLFIYVFPLRLLFL